ncbi:MAG: hypothetical protein HBSAPP03_23460 [Phycisphaerae bacterium]|nr:MAG: hypothetical protein HBSAPP03_23460 [Phycisphaerae bacterium]
MSIRSTVVSHPFTSELIRRKAAHLCRRPGFSRTDEEDLRQEMSLYLWTKARLFDAQRGNIEAFVNTALTSWVAMELRRRRRIKRRDGFRAISLEGTFVECDGQLDSLASVTGEADHLRRTGRDTVNFIEHIEVLEAYRAIDAALTRRERALLRDVIDHGVAGAARIRRVSRRQIDRALAAIRNRFNPDDRAGPEATA